METAGFSFCNRRYCNEHFNTVFGSPTAEDIEMRVCRISPGVKKTLLEDLEIYVQTYITELTV